MRSRLTSLRAAPLDNSRAAGPEFERLVEQVTAQLQSGEPIDLQKLAEEHPEYAEQIRELLPAIEMLLRIGEGPAHRAATNGEASSLAQPQQLGDFRILRELGRGGMGVVYEAEQLSLGRRVALKVLPFAGMLDKQQLTRFKNEARAAATLDHPNIVAVHFVGSERGVHFYAMQLIEGQSLAEVIEGLRISECGLRIDTRAFQSAISNPKSEMETAPIARLATLSAPGSSLAAFSSREYWRTIARLGIQAAAALDVAHQNGILHRDIKPANLLVDNTGKLWITDFGVARMEQDAGMTMTGDLLGTLRYMSPEQALAKRVVVDHRSDIYSLGATLYELITLQPVFKEIDRSELLKRIAFDEPRPPRQINRRIPVELETIVLKAMRKGPEQRYATAQELADDLQRFLDNRPIKAKPMLGIERAFRWANRNRGLAASFVGALFVVSIVALVANALILRANSRTAAALETSQANGDKFRKSFAAAEASARKTRELLYAADMARAGEAWRKHEIAHVREVLNRYAVSNNPASGSTLEDLRGFEWYYLDRQVPPQPELLFQNDAPLYRIEFMSNGREFFTAGRDSIVRWHDADSGNVLRHLDTQQQEINDVSYNQAGTLFATAGDDGTVKIWNASDQSLLQSIKVDGSKCWFAKFVDNDHVIVGGDFNATRLFEVVTGRRVREYVMPDAGAPAGVSPGPADVYVSRNGSQFWTCTRSVSGKAGCIQEWNLTTGPSRTVSAKSGINRVRANRSEEYLFVNTTSADLRILQASDGEERWSTHLTYSLHAMAVSNDERHLAVGDLGGYVYLWNLNLEQGAESLISADPVRIPVHKSKVHGAAFSSDGKSLVTVGNDGAVRRLPVITSNEPFREVTNLLKNASILTASAPIGVLANEPLRFPDAKANRPGQRDSLCLYPPGTVAPEGTLVASVSNDRLGIMSVATGEIILNVDFERTPIQSMDFSPDNSRLAITSGADNLRQIDIVDFQTGTVSQFLPPGNPSLWAHFCVDDGLVASLRGPEKLVCWNVHDKKMRWEAKPFDRRPYRGAMSRDRKLMIVATIQDIALVDCITGAVRYRARAKYPIERIEFLANDRSFVVGGTEGQVSLWQTSTGQHLFEIGNFGSDVWRIWRLDSSFVAWTGRTKDGRKEISFFEF